MPVGVSSDSQKVNTTETASLLSGIAESDEECGNPLVCLEEDAEEQEDIETVLDDC